MVKNKVIRSTVNWINYICLSLLENDSWQRRELKYRQGVDSSSSMTVPHTPHIDISCRIKPLERSLPKEGRASNSLISAHLRTLSCCSVIQPNFQ